MGGWSGGNWHWPIPPEQPLHTPFSTVESLVAVYVADPHSPLTVMVDPFLSTILSLLTTVKSPFTVPPAMLYPWADTTYSPFTFEIVTSGGKSTPVACCIASCICT
jgi:hypothetical protein